MNRLYKTIAPSVIDDEMLEEAVKKQGPSGRAGQIAQLEGIDFKDVHNLQLDYRNILKIDNLWRFKSLTKLQLDNNVIEKIEGLKTLINLVWLDLSFNNIEMIEGMDELVKLEDLSLYSNRITNLENMNSLVNLQIFSIGKNHISKLETIIYLRRFKRLRTVNLAGNPICEDERYSMYIPAFLPNLMYLDFRLIDKTTKEMALEMHRSAVANLVYQEDVTFKKHERIRLQEEELALHKLFGELQHITDSEHLETMIKNFRAEIDQLWSKLMNLEMQLVDQLELFVDKDTVINTVNASHDLHLLKIDNQEDKMVTRANGWAADTIDKLHTDEINRNRKRVLEINIYLSHWRDELDFLELQETT
ncbi:dynein regulatory complex subunit 3 isoform X2 [Scyliorhinus canicula]|uniref:dynein regulatory complex subunit 3 isoform X2 n=1 Tax=Scyliorhinus canicula TaxID=7830 RepID=UPI0018F398EF|nr:dynein regulatory complex subunit 3 isoform X2 [Scyliorhinus canicula]